VPCVWRADDQGIAGASVRHDHSMRIAVASGKGGTGKTTVAVSLALSVDGAVHFADCDVEEPNAALFLHPKLTEHRAVNQLIPEVDAESCTACGRCAEVCQYHAIAVIGQEVLVFPELCHGCGSCTRNCPVGAIHEVPHAIGLLERGHAGDIAFAQGTLDVGEPMAVPIIRALKQWSSVDVVHGRHVILDAPPGASCPVVETMRGADVVLLVTEPTPFGLHDLKVAVQVARDELHLPVAVVINRDGVGDAGVDAYCRAEGIPILLRIPLERAIAEGIAQGQPLVEIVPAYRERFADLWSRLAQMAVPTERSGVGQGGSR
jgi:MinD superfamily P-loop ATPase